MNRTVSSRPRGRLLAGVVGALALIFALGSGYGQQDGGDRHWGNITTG